MPSKLVTTREKSTRSLSAAATTHADAIAASIATELGPFVEKGEKLPNIALLVHLLDRKLRANLDTLITTDAVHENELGDDAAPRNARDDRAEKVRTTLVDLRDAISTAYGPSALRKLGLEDPIPNDPASIAARARSVRENLLSDSIKLGEPRRPSLKVDRKGFANEIDADLPELGKALEDVAREEREAKGTLTQKNAAMATHDRSFSRAAALLSALAAAGGLEDLAGTFRPSGRKSGRTAAEESEAEASSEGAETTQEG